MDTPQTLDYMYMGYVVFSVIGLGYMASLWLRARNLEKDIVVIRAVAESDGTHKE